MRALLIAPAERSTLAFLARSRPLVLVPVCGRNLLDVWLRDLATRGAKRVHILAVDRPEQIREFVGRGERWGLQVEIIPESRELTPEEAREKFRVTPDGSWLAAPWDVSVADRLPGGEPWRNPGEWFARVRSVLEISSKQSVGYRQFSPDVFVHVRARVAPNAYLEAPCWVGANACVAPGARIGPDSVIEDGAYVDEGSEVRGSWVGPDTYVGAHTEVRESLAWGRGLYKWRHGSFTEVTDEFLLSELSRRATRTRHSNWLGRLLALLVLLMTSPVVLVAWLRTRGGPLFELCQAARTPVTNHELIQTFHYYELNGVSGLWRRWPQLWNIVRGEFGWVGNRPLTRSQVLDLETDFERLWVAVPAGVFSLADAEGCEQAFGDEARAHASFYAVKNDLGGDLRILWRAFTRAPAELSGTVVGVTRTNHS